MQTEKPIFGPPAEMKRLLFTQAQCAALLYANHMRRVTDLREKIAREEKRIADAFCERLLESDDARDARIDACLAHWPETLELSRAELATLEARTVELKSFFDACHTPLDYKGRVQNERARETIHRLHGISRRYARRQQLVELPQREDILPFPSRLYGIWKTALGREYMFTREHAVIFARDSATSIAYRVADSAMTVDYEDKDVVEIVTNGCAERGFNVRFFDDSTWPAQREKEIETALAFWGIERVPLTDDRRPTIWGEVFVPGRPYPLKPERH